jgi:hypothetical protein
MSYAYPAREFAADLSPNEIATPVKKVLHTIGKLQRNSLVPNMHQTCPILYVHDYITKLCRKQAQVVQNHKNSHIQNIGQDGQHRKYKTLKLGGGLLYNCSCD